MFFKKNYAYERIWPHHLKFQIPTVFGLRILISKTKFDNRKRIKLRLIFLSYGAVGGCKGQGSIW